MKKHVAKAKPAFVNQKRLLITQCRFALAWTACAVVLCFTGLGANSAQAAIAQRGAATTKTGVPDATTLVINVPTGVVAGDVMIVNIVEYDSVTGYPTCTGWTSIQSAIFTATKTGRGAVLYKVSTGSEPASYTFALSGPPVQSLGSMVAFSGVDTTGGYKQDGTSGGPFDVTPVAILVSSSSSATAVGATAITTVSANAAVLMVGLGCGPASASTWSGWTTTSPGSLTELYDNQAGSGSEKAVTIGAAWATKATAGTTGAGAATLSSGCRNGGILIALKLLPPDTHTWTGGGSSANWSDAANWDIGLPSNGDNLAFSGTTRQTNVNDLLTSVGIVVISEGGFSISATALTLNGTFGSTGNNTWSIPLTLTSAGKYFESLDGTLVLSGNIINGGNTATFKANYGIGVDGPITVSGIISGTGGLIKDGSGTVTLTRDNTYSGKTTLTAGHLAVSKDSNLGTVPGTAAANIELNGGYLEASSTFTLNSKRLVKITATGGDTGFWSNSGVTLTYGGVISAMNTSTSYGLRLDGEGTIVLSGTNTYYGTTTIYAYVVRISNAKAFGSSASTAVEVNNLSTLELTGGITVNKPLTLDYANLVNQSGNNTWSGEIQTLVNTSGKSVVSAAASTRLTLSGSIFINTDTETSPLNQMENLYVEGAGDIDIAGVIDGDGTDGAGSYLLGHGDVVMDGTGTLTLSGENTHSGRTIVNSGYLAISTDGNLGAVPGTATAGRIVINGGTLEALATFTMDANRGIALGPFTGSGSGTIQVDADCTVDYAGIIADNAGGTDDFYLTGAGTLILSGENTYSGVTTINAGALLVNNTSGSGTGAGAVTVNDTGTLGGNGTIGGTLTVASGGRVEPGATAAGVDTLKIGGDVTFESGSTYEVEIGGGTSCDRLDLKGTGTLTLGSGVSILDIGTVTGEGRTVAINVKRNGITGEFKDTAGNLLENNSALHLSPNTAYYIHYVNKTATDDGYIVLNTSPTAAEGIIRAYATPSGVVVEFQTTEEAGQNDIVLYLFRDGQWVEVGRQPAAGEGSHTYRFVVAGLNAGDIVNLLVRDDEGKTHTVNGLEVSSFANVAVRIAQAGESNLRLQWDSIPGRTYDIYRAWQLDGEWELIRTVEAVQTQSEAVITFDDFHPSAFFRICVR